MALSELSIYFKLNLIPTKIVDLIHPVVVLLGQAYSIILEENLQVKSREILIFNSSNNGPKIVYSLYKCTSITKQQLEGNLAKPVVEQHM